MTIETDSFAKIREDRKLAEIRQAREKRIRDAKFLENSVALREVITAVAEDPDKFPDAVLSIAVPEVSQPIDVKLQWSISATNSQSGTNTRWQEVNLAVAENHAHDISGTRFNTQGRNGNKKSADVSSLFSVIDTKRAARAALAEPLSLDFKGEPGLSPTNLQNRKSIPLKG